MKWIALVLAAGAAFILNDAANAQTVGIGTTSGGANAQVGSAISGVVSSHTDLEMRPQRMGGSRYIPMVNAGQLEFGVANIMEYSMAQSGTGLSEGQPHEKLLLAGTLMNFIGGIVAPKNSDIRSVADLQGKRIPTGYSSAPLFHTFWEAFLSAEDLTWDDVVPVPVTTFNQSFDAFKQGQVDAVIAPAGSAGVRELDAAVAGGVMFIPLLESREMLELLPRTRMAEIEPSEAMTGVDETTPLHVYEYVLFTHEDAPEDVVYNVVKALYENAEELRSTSPLWDTYVPANLAMDLELDYHPGAMRYFEEQGLDRR